MIAELCREHGRSPEALLPVLQAVQARRGTLTDADVREVALGLRVAVDRARGVATFYAMLSTGGREAPEIRVCDGAACWLAADRPPRDALVARHATGRSVARSSCLGLCDRAPAALVGERQVGPVSLGDDLPKLAAAGGECSRYAEPRSGEARVLLHAVAPDGDSASLDEARSRGAWEALVAALSGPPSAVLDEVDQSGLRGRGGAGFPTGRKWRTVAGGPPPRAVVCNADESEPLSFKDRVLLDATPHRVLEGMALCAFAVGADEGIVYVRGEYELQARRLERAVAEAEAAGLLGDGVLGTRFRFRVQVHRGAGAYICGEETALLESLEGRRGEPRLRPPFPATVGLHGRPTALDNVETFAAVPGIVQHGASWFRALGQRGAAGTKLYTVLGHVRHPGLVEAPLGLTLRELALGFGGGMREGSRFRFALVGGAAGVLVPVSALDAPLDYRGGAEHALEIGAGGVLVCDESVPVAALLAELLFFFEAESCGKCTPCRIGTHRARVVLDRIVAGAGTPSDTDELARLAEVLASASFCGLGVSAAAPLHSALTHFRSELP